mmetsp:Transcript_25376/g.80108  ORF Transcript_25376/g.80108 Transcript_25376/m.80108 type:complete len:549 (+) Transcript_25376:2783-4429(+)
MRWLLVLALSPAAAQHQQAAAAEQAAWVPHVQRGFAAQSAGRWQDAVAAYTAAVDSGTVPADHQLSVASNLGLALQNVGQLDEALSWFDKVLRAHPSNADAHHNRGNVLYLQQRHAEAADAFGRAVALVPTDAESVFNQGNALAKMGHHAAAAAAFASVLRLTPRDAHASYNYANSLSAAGNTAEAISAYKATLRLSPQHSAAQTNLGLQLSAAGRYTEAAAALATAVELAPRDSASHVALGYARKSDPAATPGGAEEAFRAALALEPTLSSAYLGLASVLKATDPVSAVAAFGAAGRGEEAISGAEALGAWLDRLEVGEGSAVAVGEAAAGGGTQATAQGAPGAGPTLGGLSLDGPSLGGPISDGPISDGPAYPDVFEQAPRCASLPFGDVNTAGGAAARETLMAAATHAGIAFSNASVTLIHGMSRPIGAAFHVPHGLSNAMLLPAVTAFSVGGAPRRYAQAATAMGWAAAGDDDATAGSKLIAGLRALCADLEVPSPRQYGIDRDAYFRLIPTMVEQAITSGSPANNPRLPTPEEIAALYREVYE